jgi:hypothetical protein
MLQNRQSPATTAVTTEHPVATTGRYLVRYALVVVIAWIGALKYTVLSRGLGEMARMASPGWSRAFIGSLGAGLARSR